MLSTAIGTGLCFDSSIMLFNEEYQTFHGSLPLNLSHIIDLDRFEYSSIVELAHFDCRCGFTMLSKFLKFTL
jgi:hypothetical protein